jgi:hypothetical protein
VESELFPPPGQQPRDSTCDGTLTEYGCTT